MERTGPPALVPGKYQSIITAIFLFLLIFIPYQVKAEEKIILNCLYDDNSVLTYHYKPDNSDEKPFWNVKSTIYVGSFKEEGFSDRILIKNMSNEGLQSCPKTINKLVVTYECLNKTYNGINFYYNYSFSILFNYWY